MIHSNGSPAASQSAWDFLKNIPSRLVGWFQGKFVTIASKINCFSSGDGRTQSARQSDRTPIVERRVTSDAHKHYHRSVPTTHVSTLSAADASHEGYSIQTAPESYRSADNSASLPECNGFILRLICKEVLGGITEKIKTLMEDLEAKNQSEIQNMGLLKNTVERLRNQHDDQLFVFLARKIGVKESIIKLRDYYGKVQKFNIIKDAMDEKNYQYDQCLKDVQHYLKELKVKADEYHRFGVDLLHRYRDNRTESASEKEVKTLQSGVLWFELMLDEFINGQVEVQIDNNPRLQKMLSGIREELQGLLRLLQIQ